MEIIARSESKNESEDTKPSRTSSLTTGKYSCNNECVVEINEADKSEEHVRRVYSVERTGLETSATTFNIQDKSSDKFTRCSRLFRISSIKLEGCNQDEAKIESKVSFTGDTRSPNVSCVLDLFEMKKFALKNYIHENPKVADFKWSLFCAACHSYRYDSVLRPFPPMFLKNDVKDIDRLRDVVESCPSFSVIFDQIQERYSNLLTVELIHLLYWVLVHNMEPQLKFVPKDKHKNILSSVMYNSTAAAPHYILQVQYNRQSELERFNELAKHCKIINAFHGSRLDNFYSILNYGIRISFNKMSEYGPGIQLSSEMDADLQNSQSGFSWGGSFFGSQISVIALCDVIDHPDVKYQSRKDRDRKKGYMSDVGSLPDKLFVVPNYELIRVKYLLVYCNTSPESSAELPMPVAWFQKNKFVAVMLAYVFLLIAIATSNSSTLYKYYRRIIKYMRVRIINM